MQLNYVPANFLSGIPLTLIAVLAVVRPPDLSWEDGLFWVTLAMTVLAFLLPPLWRRAFKR